MKVIDVYAQYFAGECVYNDVERRGAYVRLTATSEEGNIRYDAGVSFFPHREEDDFAVSYDACAERVLYSARGRRSKKREAELMKTFRAEADAAAETLGGRILWDRPLRDARLG